MDKDRLAEGTNEQISIAIIGCGRISKNHIQAIQYHKNQSRIVALCDTNNANLKNIDKLIKRETKDLEGNVNPILYENFDQLLEDLNTGNKFMKVYKQMKMYNDEETNPVLYKDKS